MQVDPAAGKKRVAPAVRPGTTVSPKKARAADMKAYLLQKKKAGAVATTLNYTGKRVVSWKGVKVAARTAEMTGAMAFMMRAQGVTRQQAARDFRENEGNVSNDRAELTERWGEYVKGLTEEAKFGLGADAIGLAKRAALTKEGFHTSSGGMGKYRPYYIENGIMRGGITGRGRETEDGGFAIPARLASDPTRKLQSIMAKYTDPAMFPSTRMVKYVRGHWGSGARGNDEHKLW